MYGKFGRDVVWNAVAVGILAVAGLLISLVIGRFYGSSALGVFNQTFAFYTIVAQLAAGGMHYSVLRHAAEHSADRSVCARIVSSSLGLAAVSAALVSCASALLRRPIGIALNSPDTATSLLYVVPGVFFFALNKVLMNYLNALRQMRAFAVFQVMRYVCMAVFLVVFILLRFPGPAAAGILSCAEILLFLALVSFVSRRTRLLWPSQWMGWGRISCRFGLHALPGGVLTDLNTRIEVLVLGMFASDSVVGVYSLAAMFMQGVSQLGHVLMVNVNPIISRLFFSGRRKELVEQMRRGIRLAYIAIGGGAAAAVIVYPLIVRAFLGRTDFAESWALFGIQAGGIIIAAGYLPLMMLPTQTGRPELYALLLLAIGCSKIILSLALIPPLGMYGAAAAAALSFSLSALYLRILAKRSLGVAV
ncbi:MAG: oligosaccharide flippase family protein [Candidatus Bipolaricaulia bacterium]